MDRPARPSPRGELPATFPYARNSFGFAIASNNCPAGQTSVSEMMATRNYQFAGIPFTMTGCVTKGSPLGGLNHFEVVINQSRIEIWASDAGSSVVKQVAVANNPNLTLTRGVVWLEEVHYNACKFANQCDHETAWTTSGSTDRPPTAI